MDSIRIVDLLISVVLFTLLSPIIVIGMILSFAFIGWPPVYVSIRRGLHGKGFRHYKIKTMIAGRSIGRSYLEQERLNQAGRLLRRLHIDELPELIHVLSGTMSLVGPRPLLEKFLDRFDTGLRESVRPGLTCLAQIKLARKGFLAGPEQIYLDNVYVRKRRARYNLTIICATLCALFRSHKQIIDPAYNDYRKRLSQ